MPTLFDLLSHVVGYVYWDLFSLEWIIIQVIISSALISLCYTSERFKINLEEFPQKVPEK